MFVCGSLEGAHPALATSQATTGSVVALASTYCVCAADPTSSTAPQHSLPTTQATSGSATDSASCISADPASFVVAKPSLRTSQATRALTLTLNSSFKKKKLNVPPAFTHVFITSSIPSTCVGSLISTPYFSQHVHLKMKAHIPHKRRNKLVKDSLDLETPAQWLSKGPKTGRPIWKSRWATPSTTPTPAQTPFMPTMSRVNIIRPFMSSTITIQTSFVSSIYKYMMKMSLVVFVIQHLSALGIKCTKLILLSITIANFALNRRDFCSSYICCPPSDNCDSS